MVNNTIPKDRLIIDTKTNSQVDTNQLNDNHKMNKGKDGRFSISIGRLLIRNQDDDKCNPITINTSQNKGYDP